VGDAGESVTYKYGEQTLPDIQAEADCQCAYEYGCEL
jgi:hypothetical protein